MKNDNDEIYITNHSVENEQILTENASRGLIEGLTRIKPITINQSLVTEIIKLKFKEKLTETEYDKIVQIHFNEFLELKNSL